MWINDLLDPDKKPSMTSFLLFISTSLGVIFGLIAGFLENESLGEFCTFLVGGGLLSKISQFGITKLSGRKDE